MKNLIITLGIIIFISSLTLNLLGLEDAYLKAISSMFK